MRTIRAVHIGIVGAASACAALLVALWWQYYDGLQPCSLCWVQRGEVLLILAGFALYGWYRRAGAAVALAAAVAGIVTALLQLGEVHGTAPALGVCALTASGVPSCAVAGAHRILGIRLVDWSLGGFVLWLLLGLVAVLWRSR